MARVTYRRNKRSDAHPTLTTAESETSSATRTLASRTNEPKSGEVFDSEFLDNLAHQMVAPLQAIESHCNNVVNGIVPTENVPVRLREVIGHSRMLAELARRMRFLHQLATGAVTGPEQTPFSKIVGIWIDSWNNYLPHMKLQGLEMVIDNKQRANSLPPVQASPLAAQQVVMNILENALKYAKKSTDIHVSASISGDYITNKIDHVADAILTQDACQRMFSERGYRAPEARAIRASGTGIGMYISRSLMRSMGGDLVAIPTDEGGHTVFVLTWRLA